MVYESYIYIYTSIFRDFPWKITGNYPLVNVYVYITMVKITIAAIANSWVNKKDISTGPFSRQLFVCLPECTHITNTMINDDD